MYSGHMSLWGKLFCWEKRVCREGPQKNLHLSWDLKGKKDFIGKSEDSPLLSGILEGCGVKSLVSDKW